MRASKKTILLVLVIISATVVITTIASILLSKTTDIYVPSFGTIKTLGVEAYWDRNLTNRTETVNWGTIWPGSLRNVTLYVLSISNLETTLSLEAMNWNPADISEFMTLSWNYNGTTIQPNEAIKVTLTLSVSPSDSFIQYLITHKVEQFSLDIVISTSEFK